VIFSQSSTVTNCSGTGGCPGWADPRAVDRDAQQTAGGSLQIHQVKTQSGDGLLDGVLPAIV
jgi:hypothetical protein